MLHTNACVTSFTPSRHEEKDVYSVLYRLRGQGNAPKGKNRKPWRDGTLTVSFSSVTLFADDRSYLDGDKSKCPGTPSKFFEMLQKQKKYITEGYEMTLGRHEMQFVCTTGAHLPESEEPAAGRIPFFSGSPVNVDENRQRKFKTSFRGSSSSSLLHSGVGTTTTQPYKSLPQYPPGSPPPQGCNNDGSMHQYPSSLPQGNTSGANHHPWHHNDNNCFFSSPLKQGTATTSSSSAWVRLFFHSAEQHIWQRTNSFSFSSDSATSFLFPDGPPSAHWRTNWFGVSNGPRQNL